MISKGEYWISHARKCRIYYQTIISIRSLIIKTFVYIIQMSSENQKLMEAKTFVQTFLSSFTQLTLTDLQVYLSQLEKQASSHSNQLFGEVDSLQELMNTVFDAKHKSCVHFAAARGDLTIFKYVVETYHPNLAIKDQEHRSPFMTAVAHGHLDLVKYLVEECHQDVNQTTEGGIGALHTAANNNNAPLIKYLVSKGADINQKSDFAAPLNWAVGSNCVEAALELLENGASPDGDLTSPFPPPLIIAIDFNNQQIYTKLMQKGASLDVKDPKGYSVLQLASEKGNLKLVKELIEKGADVSYECEGKSAYYLAFESNQWKVVEFLRKFEKDYISVQQKIKELKSAAAPIQETEATRKEAVLIKEEGNKLFASGQHLEAVAKYSEAIRLDSLNHILYSNRAASYLALTQFDNALMDAARAKEICPKHTKSVYREAQAYAGLNNFLQAAASYWQASQLQPQNKELQANFKKYADLARNKH